MNQRQILQELDALPSEAQKLVADLVSMLSQQYKHSKGVRKPKVSNLAEEPFIGIWHERNEMQDSSLYVRSLRKSEWK